MAGGIDWFRWHHGSVNDPKFGLIAKKAGATVAEVIAVWATLLESASASDKRGFIGSMDFDAMDFGLGLDDGMSQRIFGLMCERALIHADTGHVSSWDKRQVKREREDENSTERSRAFRQRKRHATPESTDATPESTDATPCNAMQRTETPRVEKSREENSREEEVVVASPQAAQPTSASPPPKSAAGTRLPENWTLPDDWRCWSESARPDLDALEVAASFRDFWVAKPGKDGRKADWLATWRNWVRMQRSNQPLAVRSVSPSVFAGAI